MDQSVAAPAPPASAVDPLRKQIARLEEQQTQRDFAQLSCKLRKRPLVLFFGRNNFADNSKYLYLRALATQRGYEVLWCATSNALADALKARGLPCLAISRNLDITIDTFLHAAVSVFTINPFESVGLSLPLLGCLAGSAQVQLWHGISVKRLNLQLLPHMGARRSDINQYWLANCGANHVLSTSSLLDGYWREVFGCNSMLRAGMPRNEVLVREATGGELLGSELPDGASKALQGPGPAILVVPTWQRGKATELTEGAFLARALQFARQHAGQIFYKAHPSHFGRWDAPAEAIDNLHLLDPGVDVYPWMNRFDALVTDYSSIMFDFLLTGKPVLTIDIEDGSHQSFEPDYSLVPPGDFRTTFRSDRLVDALTDALGQDRGLDARRAYAQCLFETDPALACDSLLAVLDILVERSQRADHQVWAVGR
jgi:CDP-glycerol glycerophosphotransferase (TagB/SpsB family)